MWLSRAAALVLQWHAVGPLCCRAEQAGGRLFTRGGAASRLRREPLLGDGDHDRSDAVGVGPALGPGWFTEEHFVQDAQKMQEMPPYIGWKPRAPKPTGHGCNPHCEWQCPPTTECDQTCTPYCMPPKCQTFCERHATDGCETRCGPPQCSIVCPPGRITGEPAGKCQTVCVPPICRTECTAVKGHCQSECEDPMCTWKCKLAVACPKPNCTLKCTGIEQCRRPHRLSQTADRLEVPSDHVGVTYGSANLDVAILAKPAVPYPEFTPTTKSASTSATPVAAPAPSAATAVARTTTTPATPAGTTPIGPVRRLKLKWESEDENWVGHDERGSMPHGVAPTWTRETPVLPVEQ